jgi:hypothetical protein
MYAFRRRLALYYVFSAFVVGFGGLLLSGCVYTSEIAKTRKAIEDEPDARIDTGIIVGVGPGLFQTAGWLVGIVDDAEAQEVGRVVSGIRRVKAGVYPVSEMPDLEQLDLPSMTRFKRKGWRVALKVEDYGEVSWLLYRERHHRVHDLFVISVTEDELVLARIQGHLDALLDYALLEVEDEHGWDTFDFDTLFNP